jgi:hypothetical protein
VIREDASAFNLISSLTGSDRPLGGPSFFQMKKLDEKAEAGIKM